MSNTYVVSYLLILVSFPTGRGRCTEFVYYTVKAPWWTKKHAVASRAPGTAVSALCTLAHSSSQQSQEAGDSSHSHCTDEKAG